MANTYNGYTNWETWNYHLHMTNDSGCVGHYEECAAEALKQAADTDAAVDTLASELESECREAMENAVLPDVLSDLLEGTVGEINWREIARLYIDEAKEDSE